MKDNNIYKSILQKNLKVLIKQYDKRTSVTFQHINSGIIVTVPYKYFKDHFVKYGKIIKVILSNKDYEKIENGLLNEPLHYCKHDELKDNYIISIKRYKSVESINSNDIVCFFKRDGKKRIIVNITSVNKLENTIVLSYKYIIYGCSQLYKM